MSTLGIDHVGLTVTDLAASQAFFVDCLGWEIIGGNPAYPSAYVTDGLAKLNLWQQRDERPRGLDRHANVGVYHTALKVADAPTLAAVFDKVKDFAGVAVEFAPELLGNGPKVHFMIREPGGTRLEFCYDPR